MIAATQVRANVVDIGNPASATPTDLVADANVLFWIFYRNFGSLAAAGGKGPLFYQINTYPVYWAKVARKGCRFFTANTTIGEFAKVSEYAELEAIWLTDSPRPQPDPANPATLFDVRICKFARYSYASFLSAVRRDIELTIALILKSVTLLNLFGSAIDQHNQASAAWLASLGDYPDAMVAASALNHGTTSILSDDADFATFPGLTLYTANRHAIAAARTAGKLI